MNKAEQYYKMALTWYELAVYYWEEYNQRETTRCKIEALLCIHRAKQELGRFNNDRRVIEA